MHLPVKKLFYVELLSKCLYMRNLVIARITELWDERHYPELLDLSLHELPSLSNADLLEVLEEIIELIA